MIDDLLGCRSTLFNVKRADFHAVGPVGVSSNIRRTADNANELEVEHNTSHIFVDETDQFLDCIYSIIHFPRQLDALQYQCDASHSWALLQY